MKTGISLVLYLGTASAMGESNGVLYRLERAKMTRQRVIDRSNSCGSLGCVVGYLRLLHSIFQQNGDFR